jgi:outer membrane cobalamin receptor
MLVLGAALAAAVAPRGARADGDEGDRPPDPDVEVFVVRGVRPAELAADPSSFSSVIDLEAFEGENKSVVELLDQTVGVQVRRFGGAGQEAEISIRGSNGRQVVIMLDGVRINSAQSGSADLASIPRDLIERIEVSRGGGSTQSGSGAIGGVVNIVTKRARAEPRTSLAFARGSFETWEVAASQTGRLSRFDLALGYEFFKTEGNWTFAPLDLIIGGVPVPPDETERIERVNNRTENHSGMFKVGRDLGDHFRLELSDQVFWGQSGRPGLDQPEGGELHGQSLTAQSERLRNLADLTLRAADWTPLALEAELRGFYRYERNQFEDETPPTGPPLDSDDRDTTGGARLDLGGDFELAASQHASSLSFSISRDALDSKQAGDHVRRVLGLALQDEIALFERRVRIVPAIRYDDTEGFASEWLPRVGVILEPWPWLRIKGNAERAYRAPTFNELYFNEGSLRGNPALLPEESRNFDVGVELGLDQLGPFEDLFLEVVGFRNEIDNSIVFQPVSPNVVAATNVSEALSRGIELAGRLQLFEWIRFSGNWTHLDTKILRTGNPLPGRPEDEVALRLEFGPRNRAFKLVGEGRYTDDIPTNEGGGRIISGRTVYDASLVVDLVQLPRLGEHIPLRRFLLSVNGTNLSDVAVRDAQSFPQPGRFLGFRAEVYR